MHLAQPTRTRQVIRPGENGTREDCNQCQGRSIKAQPNQRLTPTRLPSIRCCPPTIRKTYLELKRPCMDESRRDRGERRSGMGRTMEAVQRVSAFSIALIALLISHGASAADPRICEIQRYSNGEIKRSAAVVSEFKRLHPCPSTGSKFGSCPGWYIDHVIPLACGGCDSVQNLQWLTQQQWLDKSKWERKVYGGRSASKGCP